MKAPKTISGVEVEPIDILQMELDEKLPYWLAPSEKDSAKRAAKRRELYRRKWRERKQPKK